MTTNPLFTQVKIAITQWLKNNGENFENKNVSIAILQDDEICLRVEFRFEKCLAEAIVTEPDFAPYRFVEFDAFSLHEEMSGEAWFGKYKAVPKRVHYWCDEKANNIEEIIENLNKAIDIVWEYNNKIS